MNKKLLTRKELTGVVQQQAQEITKLKNTVQVLDAGLFITIYSLLHEKKVFVPDHIKTADDIVNAGVSEVISKMVEITNKVAQNGKKK